MRRSLLFLPGNQPNMLQNGGVLPADALILDLEDAVAPTEKDAARELVASALRDFDFGDRERVVRINGIDTPYAIDDLRAVVAAGADTVMVPKVVGKKTIDVIDRELDRMGADNVQLIALIETAVGIEFAYEAATASKRMVALALGAEDLSADLGCQRTKAGTEIFYSRTRLVNAARAADIQAIDTPFTDARDLQGCFDDAAFAKSLGFTGKLSISPHHLQPIHDAFAPSERELQFALDVVEAMERAKAEGLGAVSLHGKMIDPPVVRQAELTLDMARASGLLDNEGGSR